MAHTYSISNIPLVSNLSLAPPSAAFVIIRSVLVITILLHDLPSSSLSYIEGLLEESKEAVHGGGRRVEEESWVWGGRGGDCRHLQ